MFISIIIAPNKILIHVGHKLLQGCVVVPYANPFIILYSFVKKHLPKKVMVFFSSCNSVKFHVDILNLIHLNCWSIHGKQKQQTRRTTFFDFCKSENGFLLCTDVAARGLDNLPWYVHFCYQLTSIFLNGKNMIHLYETFKVSPNS